MKIIGLTGGIACGKSTVSKAFKDRSVVVIDADEISHKLTVPGAKGYTEIVKSFGEEILDKTKPSVNNLYPINRVKLGEIVFNDVDKRKKLNKIMHWLVIKKIVSSLIYYFFVGKSAVILDVPLLFEAKLEKFCSLVVVVYTTPDKQLERLIKRNPEIADQAQARINSQMDIEIKKRKAHYVIDNNGTIEELNTQINDLCKKLPLKSVFTYRNVILSCIVFTVAFIAFRYFSSPLLSDHSTEL